MAVFCKKHFSGENSVLAVCDEGLLGKTFEDGKIFFNATESFYKGEIVSMQRLSELLDEFDNINLFGEQSVKAALDKNLADSESVLKICGIPHLQIFKI